MMRDGILKATSGALVMLKGVRKNNLYYYQGSTVVGTVATATSSNKKDAEATKLWHLRLGHAGERSLQILAKQGLLKEVWSGKPATDYDSLRIFGSIAYYHVTESKLDPRAKKALFMGFSAGVKGYRLWCLESKKTIVSRDVTFDESSMLNKVNPNSSDTSQQVEYTPKQVEFEEAVVIPTTNTTNDSPTEEEESDDEEVPPQEPSQQSEPIAVRRMRRENKKPARFADMVAYALPVVDDWTDKVVMVYYHYWIYGEGLYQPCKPYLLSYNIVEDKWDKFEDNIYMTRERGPSFMWGEIFYSLSTMHVFGSSTICPPKRRCGKCASEKSFLCRSSTYSCGAGDDNYCNQEYAKFEVVQGKGRDYTATDIFSFDHNLC
ncbi:hypothetical protein SASPL_104463 [Salvia splendens]|uniref:GAG-pre-integrase domain-containing protein n=1 Tax=Salvia splendens TaxID=180675 RepID=A0A8X8YJA2_SALSN|nr:hypothetical protein SASPL_104463 [Salvia splendens]